MIRPILRIILLITVSIALLGCGGGRPSSAAVTTNGPPPLPADVQQVGSAVVAPATTAAATSTEELSGDAFVSTGEFVSPVRSELAPKVAGRVSRMFVEAGSIVSRGQPVLTLETDYLSLQLQQAQAEAARAKAMMDEASRDVARKRELMGKDSIPRATYDRSQSMYEQARAAYAGATAQVNLMRQQIGDSTVRSPITGVVAEKRTEVGQRLADNTIAVVVVQLSPLKLRFSVPERYLGRITPGVRVQARVDPYPTETFTGIIKTVGGVIDPQTRTMFAEAEFANGDRRLRPGLFARVEAKLN